VVKSSQEAGFHSVPVVFVSLEYFQVFPPGLCFSSEDAGQFSSYSFIIPSGNIRGNLNLLDESFTSGSLLAVVGKEQGQICGPLETVVSC